MATNPKPTVKINGKDYNIADLSAKAKTQLTNLRVTDAEIQRLKAQISICQTARNAYLGALVEELPKG